ncbi:specificity determinant for hsdM and hsdR [Acinetobacter junii]|uniref:restriction endonuclease subunit S n=2 Tax=Acinetobacter junii TaxID=40215 RepID=UPI0002CF5308|nr:restriction endonuclease subunit S [Acinetobacter junii]ENV66711.1 hypothetical protein F948_01682 [Acinetobacter junii CIP 64.5]MEB8381497.1 restriction endonuclease subunit S [Acinetobacter junii]SUU11095.1 specificity determinant for hsdM and hsdR [Acinetobacter junii]SUU14388.1 specificity determinant for hsdM and hsdR [Acinetobacter junii]
MSLDNLAVEWSVIDLESLSEFIIGGDWGKDTSLAEENYIEAFCIRGAEFKNWKTDKSKTAVPRKLKTSSLDTRRLNVGDILVEISGGGPDQPVGRTVYIEELVFKNLGSEDIVCTNFLRLFRPTSIINAKYLNFYLSFFYKTPTIVNYQSGSNNLRNLQFKDYLKLEIPIASLAEQQEIVRQLDIMLAQVEQIKARLDAIPTILKKFRQSVLADAVSGKLCRADESFKEIIVENTWKHSIYGLPHWKEYKFSDVVDIIGGSQPPKSEFRSEYQEGYIRLIQIRDYKSDSHIVYIPKEKARRFVSATDVMIGRYGPPIFQILRGLEDAYNVALMKAEPKDNLIDQEYLYWYLQNYKIYNYIEAGSDRTAGQSGVNKKHLEAYPILLPSIEEQQNIVKEIVKLTTLANRIEETLQLAEKRVNLLTQSILAKAFSGELTAEWREQHQELITGINSAKSLLAKIQAEREASKPVKKAKKVK